MTDEIEFAAKRRRAGAIVVGEVGHSRAAIGARRHRHTARGRGRVERVDLFDCVESIGAALEKMTSVDDQAGVVVHAKLGVGCAWEKGSNMSTRMGLDRARNTKSRSR